MTTVTDTILINAGIDAEELRDIKGRTALYIGTLFLAGMALTFAAMTVGNLIG